MSFKLLVPSGLVHDPSQSAAVQGRVYVGRGHAQARDGDAGTTVEVEEDAVVELGWADGTEVVVLGEDLLNRPGQRSGDGVRIPRLGATRDGMGGVLTSLAIGAAVPYAARAVANAVDRKMAGQREGAEKDEELGGVRLLDQEGRLGDLGGSPGAGNLLLLVHGTFSNTPGSFSDLYGGPDWRQISRYFEGNTAAFDHPTLSRDPVENVLRLVETLPSKARLHVVSHSRGGLVADVLAAACRPGAASEADAAARAPQRSDPHGAWLGRVRANFATAAEIAASKELTVERTLRVAAPSRGTSLAGDRLDTWLNVFLNVVGLVPALRASPIYDGVKAALKAFVKERNDPLAMPGLASMVPSGVFVRWLGAQVAHDRLTVIAGDASRTGFLERLKTLLAQLYYPDTNDWVVDTSSMDGGARRVVEGKAWAPRVHLLEDRKTPRIHHVCYFANSEVRDLVRAELTRPAAAADSTAGARGTAGYVRDTLTGRGVPDPPRKRDREAVVVVPGIMGSVLKVGGEEVWPMVAALAAGRFGELEIKAKRVSASAILAGPYRRIVRHLQGGGDDLRDVWLQPYDWRVSIERASAALARTVKKALTDAGDKPVHILAHSMGGLVARGLLAWHPELWAQLTARKGRLVMAGTPNHGSFVIPRLLLGREPVFRQLALVDLAHSEEDLLALVRQFPGIVEMMPADAEADLDTAPLLSADTWHPWWPDADQMLDGARRVRAKLAAAVDPDHMVYVAGAAGATPSALRWEGARPVFEASDAGDGRVLWAQGWLRGVPMWRMRAEHGSLLDFPRAFEGLTELLTRGSTSLLPRLDQGRGSVRSTSVVADKPVLYPSDAALEAAALGGERTPEGRVLGVRAVHGDVAHEEVVALLGHFSGDRLRSAEPSIDLVYGGALTDRLAAGRYPTHPGEAVVFPRPKAALGRGPVATLVVGLGAARRLTRTLLVEALREGLVELSFPPARDLVPAPPDGLTVALATPGCGDDSLTVGESVSAAMEAIVRANRDLVGRGVERARLITGVRFVAPYGDQAGEALRAARRWQDAPGIELEPDEQVQVERVVEKGRQLEGCPPPERPLRSRARARWRRFSAQSQQGPGGTVALEYVLPGDGAAAERKRVDVTWASVQKLASELTERAGLVEPQIRALRDHVVPARVIGELETGLDVQLGLDRVTATLPWEAFVGAGVDAEAMLSGQIAILRQLEDRVPPATVATVERGTALLVCSPGEGDKFLASAGREADLVRRKLLGRRFSVIEPSTDGSDIRARLAGQYEVVHLVGHGEYVAGDVGRTGVIAGGGDVISRHDLRGFERHPPALVFINCCHLGKLDASATALDDRSPLAADLAGYLIGVGVRAVVAAGWAVDDDAACAFADTLYGQLLAGQTFREAVAAGRIAALSAAPDTATWAAYQCYGDPEFLLPSAVAERGGLDLEILDLLARGDVVSPAETDAVIGQVIGRLRLTPDDREAGRRLVEAAWAFYDLLPDTLKSGATAYRMGRLLRLHPDVGDPQLEERVMACFRAAVEDPYAPADAFDQLESVKAVEPGAFVSTRAPTGGDGDEALFFSEEGTDVVDEGAAGAGGGGLMAIAQALEAQPALGADRVVWWRAYTAAALATFVSTAPKARRVGARGRSAELLAPAERLLAMYVAPPSALGDLQRPTAAAVAAEWRKAAGDGMDAALSAEVRTWLSQVVRALIDALHFEADRGRALRSALQAEDPELLDDPHAGGFGGLSVSPGGSSLTAVVADAGRDYWSVDVTVNVGPADAGEVYLLLHPSLAEEPVPLEVDDFGRAHWSGMCRRAFTVAAVIVRGNDEETNLEFDLGRAGGVDEAFLNA